MKQVEDPKLTSGAASWRNRLLRALRGHLTPLAAALLVLNVALVFVVHDNRSLATDVAIAREIQASRATDAGMLPLMVAVSAAGYYPLSQILFVVGFGAPLIMRCWRWALLMALTLSADITVLAIKWLVARPRPTAEQVVVHGLETNYSFPSGHVVHYVVFFGIMIYVLLLSRTARSSGLREKPARENPALRRTLDRLTGYARWAAVSMCGLLIAFIGGSRVYLGAHWPSDVAAGYLLGGAWLIALITLDQHRNK